jgi:ABC-2 type transport system permease protein
MVMNWGLFKGTGRLTRLLFRQERFKIFVWLLILVGLTVFVASAYPDIYKTDQDRIGWVATMENPAMIAMLGPLPDTEIIPIGAMFTQEMLIFTAIAAAVMNILFAARSTRSDEEDGRLELVRSLPVGRLAYLNGAVIVATVMNVLLAVMTGIGLLALDIEGIGVESAFLYGSILGATGFIFAAITFIFAQASETSRGTSLFSFSALILFYLIRAVGDVNDDVFSYFSPLGWTVRTEVFIHNKWWPILLLAGVGIVCVVVAYYLNSIRDMQSGFIRERKGRKYASIFLKNPVGLIFRLQRTNILAWGVCLFLLSAAFGAVLGDLETYFSDMELMQVYLGSDTGESMMEQFIILLMAIMSLISTIPSIMTILKIKGEENKHLTENFYSRAVSRTRLMACYVLVAVLVSFLMQSAIVLGLWSVGDRVVEGGLDFAMIYESALVYLPAIWFVIGVAVFLIGVLPKAASLVWLYVAFCFVVLYLGGLLEFPDWVNHLSTFDYVPEVPDEKVDMGTMAILAANSIVVSLIGFFGYRKRDIAG